MKYTMRDLNDIKEFFQDNGVTALGIGIYPFGRYYFEDIINNYKIITFRESLETPSIRKSREVITLESYIGSNINQLKRNGTSIVSYEVIKDFINKFNKPYIISYKGREEFELICKENGWVSCVGSYALGNQLLEDKIKFREFLEENGVYCFPKKEFFNLNSVTFEILQNKFKGKVAIQYPNSSGGKGTFFVETHEEFDAVMERIKILFKDEIKPETRLLVSKFVQGKSVSTTGVATRWGTFSSNLQTQLIDIRDICPSEKGTGVFCGHDWSASNSLAESSNLKAIEYTKLIGELIYKKGYKGFFGLDIIIEDITNEVFIIECNPRLTGVLPTLDLIQSKNNLVQFLSLHFLEYIAEDFDFEVDYEKIQPDLIKQKEGAHFFVSGKHDSMKIIDYKFKPGIYEIENNELKFISEGYSLKGLEKNQFIITEMPSKNVGIDKFGRICRVLTNAQVLGENNEFNDFGIAITESIYKNVDYLPAENIMFTEKE